MSIRRGWDCNPSVVLRRSFDKSRFATKGLKGNLTRVKLQKKYIKRIKMCNCNGNKWLAKDITNVSQHLDEIKFYSNKGWNQWNLDEIKNVMNM